MPHIMAMFYLRIILLCNKRYVESSKLNCSFVKECRRLFRKHSYSSWLQSADGHLSTISLTVKPFSCISWRHFTKPAFSRFVLFFSVSLLSNVFNDRIFLVWSSITVYVQYWAQCPGLSILPSPENQILFKKIVHTQYAYQFSLF